MKDNSNQGMLKGIILIVVLVGIVFLSIGFYWYYKDTSNEYTIGRENQIQIKVNDTSRNNSSVDNILEHEVIKGVGTSNENTKEEHNDVEMDNTTEPDFDGEYIATFGEDVVTQAKETALNAVGFWIKENMNEEVWRGVATSTFFEEYKTSHIFLDEAITRTITTLNIVSSEPTNKNEMSFSVFATWDVYLEKEIINKQKMMITVNLKENNGNWLVYSIKDFNETVK